MTGGSCVAHYRDKDGNSLSSWLGERDVGAGVHPVCAESEGLRGCLDTCEKARTRVRDAALHPLGDEGAVAVVDVARHLATGELGVEDHYGTTVDDQAHGGREVALEANRKVMQGSYEELRREQDFVVLRQRRWCGSA